MNKQVNKFIFQSLFCLTILIGINTFMPISFTGYFLICALALFLCVRNSTKYFGWLIVLIASVLITLNYLRPKVYDGKVSYNNAMHNAFVLKGLETAETLYLVDKTQTKNALFNQEEYQGFLSLDKVSKNSFNLRSSLHSQPIFVFDTGLEAYKLVNANQLMAFSEYITFKNNKGQSLSLNFKEAEDTLGVYLRTESNDQVIEDTATFKRKIREGYPISKLLLTCTKENSVKDIFISHFKGMSLVRGVARGKNDLCVENPLYLTLNDEVINEIKNHQLEIFCDGKKGVFSNEEQDIPIEENQKFYLGIGSEKTRIFRCENVSGNTYRIMYDMPIMYSFPKDSILVNSRTLTVSSNSEDLMTSDVKAAFYFNLFGDKESNLHFCGQVSYQTDASPNKLNFTFIDKKAKNNINTYQDGFYKLSTINGNKWLFRITDLRKESPITGIQNIYLSDWFNISLVIGLSLFSIFMYVMLIREEYLIDESKANGLLYVWMFFIPLVTLRLYILWRVAVFAPVSDISKYEFMLYHLENSLMDNSMSWTFFAIFIFIGVSVFLYIWEKWLKFKNIGSVSIEKYKTLFGVVFGVSLLLSCTNKLIDLPTMMQVVINVILPVSLFFFNEYFCIKGVSIGYRILGSLFVLGMLLLGDPGYAIMFFIFECIYFIILSIIYRNSNIVRNNITHAAWRMSIIFTVLVLIITTCAPWIVAQLYNSTPIFGFFKFSHLSFAILGIFILGVICYVIHGAFSKNIFKISLLVSTILVIIITIFGPVFMNYNGHFKYRALIHTQNVGEIMCNEDIATRNSKRLLEASQNQWFLQYHNNLGENRILEDGIMHIYPHFKKGVTWNTQISDVVCSRYLVSELSLLVPLAIIIFCFVFMYMVLKHPNKSSTGRTFAFGVALLLLVQTTFVWMANTNRMIFFGQDFPFISHNAHSTMLMFAMILALVMFALGNMENSSNGDNDLVSGYEHFNQKPMKIFFALFTLTFSIIFFTGNKYSNLYNSEKAKEYDVAYAMDAAEVDIDKINSVLAEYNAKRPLQPKGEDLTSLLNDINQQLSLFVRIDEMYEKGEIGEFSYSLFKAFKTNYVKDNRISNVIHLRYMHNTHTYKLSLNNGFYSLKAPEMIKNGWRGNVCAYSGKSHKSSVILDKRGREDVIIYPIPDSWLSNDENPKVIRQGVAYISEVKSKNKANRILFSGSEKAMVGVSSFRMSENDVFNYVYNNQNHLYQMAGNKENLLAKYMEINGGTHFFYPLAEKFFWIKNFTDYEMGNTQKDRNEDCHLTIDKDLTEKVYDICSKQNFTSSVITMDGLGNIRLMVDNNRHPNPNSLTEIHKFVEESYLNPRYVTDLKLFGNLNLLHMTPGPASSLKPITYAAVTSQVSTIDWENLVLRKPKEKYRIEENNNNYYSINKYGGYKYPGKGFKSLAGDEVGINGWVDNDFYLYKSSNYYNALVTYLGNYESEDFISPKSTIFRRIDNFNKDVFPIFKFKGNDLLYTFKDKHGDDRRDFVLKNGLWKNFHLSVAQDNLYNHENFIESSWMSKESRLSYPWVFPQVSTAFKRDLSNARNDGLWVKQYTLGSDPVKVTPLMMGEMYGKLFSLNPNYHATIIENETLKKGQWSDRDMFEFYQDNVFLPMEHCVSKGTARGQVYPVKNRNREYYFYAKTGTLALSEGKKDDRMLAVIITNKDISKAKSSSDYRFYVVYFCFKESGTLRGVSEILNTVVTSESFKEYMNGHKL